MPLLPLPRLHSSLWPRIPQLASARPALSCLRIQVHPPSSQLGSHLTSCHRPSRTDHTLSLPHPQLTAMFFPANLPTGHRAGLGSLRSEFYQGRVWPAQQGEVREEQGHSLSLPVPQTPPAHATTDNCPFTPPRNSWAFSTSAVSLIGSQWPLWPIKNVTWWGQAGRTHLLQQVILFHVLLGRLTSTLCLLFKGFIGGQQRGLLGYESHQASKQAVIVYKKKGEVSKEKRRENCWHELVLVAPAPRLPPA